MAQLPAVTRWLAYNRLKNDLKLNIKMESENQQQDIGSAPSPPSLTVGEKFVAWAEKHWKLEEIYSDTVKDPSQRNEENASYGAVKQAFAWFIDQEIRNRIAGF